MKLRQSNFLILFFSLFLSHFALAQVPEKTIKSEKKPALLYLVESGNLNIEIQSEIRTLQENEISVHLIELPKEQIDALTQIKKMTEKIKQDKNIL